MIKRLFPQFPLSQSPSSDPAVADIFRRYGGFLELLNSDKEVPEKLSSELRRVGYSLDELLALRALTGTDERQRLVLRAACLRKLMRSAGDVRLPSLEFEAIASDLSSHNIDEVEIEYAISHFVPFVEGWRF